MSLLYDMFTITITGSIIFILFEGMQLITKHQFSAAWHYGILKCILLFFCFPIGKLVSFLADNLFYDMNRLFHSDSSYKQSAGSISGCIQRVSTYEISKFRIYEWLVVIWITGIGILLLRQLICYIKFRCIITNNKKQASEYLQDIAGLCGMKQGIQQPIQLYVNEYINTPMLISFFSPVIILPTDNLEIKNVQYVLSHELTHYKRKDLLIKIGMLIIRTVHWFNPFVYLFSKELDRWCEYTCDEKNTMDLSLDLKKKYGLAILDTAVETPIYCSRFGTPFLSPKQNLKERLMFMLNVKKMKKQTMAVSIAIASVLLSFGFVTAFAADTGKESQLEYQKIGEEYESSNSIHNIIPSKELETLSSKRQQKYISYFDRNED